MAKKKKMPQEVAGMDISRDGDDMVIRLTGLYGVQGVETSSEKDTRKLAASPGMFTWIPDGSPTAHENEENRRLGLKVTAILGSPREEKTGTSKESADGKTMSAVSFG